MSKLFLVNLEPGLLSSICQHGFRDCFTFSDATDHTVPSSAHLLYAATRHCSCSTWSQYLAPHSLSLACCFRIVLVTSDMTAVTVGLGRDKRRLETTKGEGSLKGVFKEQGCWGFPQRLRTRDAGVFLSVSRQQTVVPGVSRSKGYYKERTLRCSAMT